MGGTGKHSSLEPGCRRGAKPGLPCTAQRLSTATAQLINQSGSITVVISLSSVCLGRIKE